MPTEPQITAQENVIRARIADFARTLPSAGGLNLDDAQLRAQAITELTGLPPAPPAGPTPEPSDLDERYVIVG